MMPVILFHAGFDIFSGGFIGVDVFFVISGYLITNILIEDIENKRFSIVDFYERRARRILPALFFVMLCCIPFAWLWLLPSDMKNFSQSLVAVSLFSSNILFWQESGYFAAAAESKPLLHTWSLAVEEQYYVLFPLFLLLCWRFGKNSVFWMIVFFAVISLALSEWGWRNEPTANFYLAPTRAWELLAGSIAAFITQKRGVKANNILSLIGLVAILVSITIYDEQTPFPSLYALLPVAGVVLLILYGSSQTYAAKFLSNKIFVGLGLISYSAYLWHQPLFAFARVNSVSSPSTELMFVLSATSLALAYLSWRFIEAPFRNKNIIDKKIIFWAVGFFGAFFILVGFIGHTFDKEYEKYWLSHQPKVVKSAYALINKTPLEIDDFNANIDGQQRFTDCRFNAHTFNTEIEQTILRCFSKHGKGILIIGDSHAIDLFGVVTSRFDYPFVIGLTQNFCRPHSKNRDCNYDLIASLVKNHPEVLGKIIYEQAGFYLLEKETGKKGDRKMFSHLAPVQKVTKIKPDMENIQETLEYLSKLSESVPVLWFLPRAEPHIGKHYILKTGCNGHYFFRPNQLKIFKDLDLKIINEIKKSNNENMSWASQNQIFDFNLSDDFMNCEKIFWSDGDHFSADGEIRFGQRLPTNFIDF